MEFTRTYMIGYLLLFCATDEALEAEFTAQYNSLQGARPSHPLCEGNTPDLYTDF